TLDFESELPTTQHSVPAFLTAAKKVHRVLKKQTPKELMSLMDISDKLADLNWQRNQAKGFGGKALNGNTRQAIYAFKGDVYIGLDAYTIPSDKMEKLQDRLRILSGLYGILKPLDLINPYRLEMGTDLPVEESKNLYRFWKPVLTKSLNKELKKGELFINLASNEYFSAVDAKALKVPVITPEFRDYKDGELKMISFFAKKARGMMVRYIIDTDAQTIEDLQGFNYEGYRFDANLSTANKLVFTR
ncbi:MAG: peroxide stress protein YaaA, partial [Flavobacterium sp.]